MARYRGKSAYRGCNRAPVRTITIIALWTTTRFGTPVAFQILLQQHFADLSSALQEACEATGALGPPGGWLAAETQIIGSLWTNPIAPIAPTAPTAPIAPIATNRNQSQPIATNRTKCTKRTNRPHISMQQYAERYATQLLTSNRTQRIPNGYPTDTQRTCVRPRPFHGNEILELWTARELHAVGQVDGRK